MTFTRRGLLQSTLAAGALVAAARTARGEPMPPMPGMDMPPDPTPDAAPDPAPIMQSEDAPPAGPTTLTRGRAVAGEAYTPVIAPSCGTLPFVMRAGVKVFHLVAEPVTHEIAPGLVIQAWGYNGKTPGPLIEAVVGDRIRVYVTNRLRERTTVHWHGVLVPSGMDGVAGLNQPGIQPGQTFKYDFTLMKAGTFMYHPHFDEMTQIALGMAGMIVVHPRGGSGGGRVRDYALMTHEWKIPIGTRRPDPLAMNDFNVLTLNSKAFPATEPLLAEVGDRVRIRFGNLGPMDHHPIHLHGNTFELTETDGGPVPASARHPETTVLVPVGAVRVVELTARYPGDWAMHCHMTHHIMNQMGHDAPNLIGVDTRGVDAELGKALPGYMPMGQRGMGDMMMMKQPPNSISMMGGKGPFGTIDMGGMFTILKVRDRLPGGETPIDPGWFTNPPGTVASQASADDLSRDGIVL